MEVGSVGAGPTLVQVTMNALDKNATEAIAIATLVSNKTLKSSSRQLKTFSLKSDKKKWLK